MAWREFSKTYGWYNVGAQCKPALRSPPAVSLTYQQPEERSPAALVQLIKFRTHFQQMLQAVSRPGQPVYVCDPYHTSMVLDPHAPIRDWLFSPAVCGEYVLFVTANGKHGLFINPWERTFCFFGYARGSCGLAHRSRSCVAVSAMLGPFSVSCFFCCSLCGVLHAIMTCMCVCGRVECRGTFVEQLKSVPPVFLETFCKLIR